LSGLSEEASEVSNPTVKLVIPRICHEKHAENAEGPDENVPHPRIIVAAHGLWQFTGDDYVTDEKDKGQQGPDPSRSVRADTCS